MAAKKKAPEKKEQVSEPPVKKASTETTNMPLAKKAKANTDLLDDPFGTAAFKKALRGNTVRHKRVYQAINSLEIENKAGILAAINDAHRISKKKLYANVDAINTETPDTSDVDLG